MVFCLNFLRFLPFSSTYSSRCTFPQTTSNLTVLNAPMCHTRVILSITHRPTLFFCWQNDKLLKQMKPLVHLYKERKRVESEFCKPQQASSLYTCALSLCYQVEPNYFRNTKSGWCLSGEATPPHWLERWLW